jgi:hypothetical protein
METDNLISYSQKAGIEYNGSGLMSLASIEMFHYFWAE